MSRLLVEKRVQTIMKNLHKIHWEKSNCWGTSLFVVGYTNIRKYVPPEKIEKIIKGKTIRVKPKVGSILVIYEGWLFWKKVIHTAVYIGKGQYFHQRGYGQCFYIESKKEILKTYHEYSNYCHKEIR